MEIFEFFKKQFERNRVGKRCLSIRAPTGGGAQWALAACPPPFEEEKIFYRLFCRLMARFAKYFILEKILNKMKLFGKMKIFEKIENKTSICFRKTGLTERQNMENKQLFSLCMVEKKIVPPFVKFLRAPLFV